VNYRMGREWKKASLPSFISAFTNSTIRIDTGTRTEETHRQMQKISHLYEQARILIPPLNLALLLLHGTASS